MRDEIRATLWSRRRTALFLGFPELLDPAETALLPGCILDGGAVVWGSGRLDFEALQRRLGVGAKRAAQLARSEPASFVAFDLLAVPGHDLRLEPLTRRRELLEELARSWDPPLSPSPLTHSREEAREGS